MIGIKFTEQRNTYSPCKTSEGRKIKVKYFDIYVLLSSALPLFALRKYTQSCNGLLVKLEANNERVYYSYHPRVCERASEWAKGRTRRRPSERGSRGKEDGKKAEEKCSSRETISTFAPSRVHFRPQKDKPERQSEPVWGRTPLNRYWRRSRNVQYDLGKGNTDFLFLLQLAEEVATKSW